MFLGLSAYLLSQIAVLQEDYNAYVPGFVKAIVDIVKQLVSYSTNVDIDSILQGIYIFLSVIVACSAVEIAGAIFSLIYSMCPCHEIHEAYHTIWVIISLVQIPSFLLLTLSAFLVAICGIIWIEIGTTVGFGIGIPLALLFGVALPLLIIGCVGCCGSCRRARLANSISYSRLPDRMSVTVYHRHSNDVGLAHVQHENEDGSRDGKQPDTVTQSQRVIECMPAEHVTERMPDATPKDASRSSVVPNALSNASIFCVGCGAKCPMDASFCPACGTAVKRDRKE